MTDYHKLAELKAMIKNLKEEADELQDKLLDRMINQDINQYKTTYGTFSIGMRRAWNYPDYVRELEEETKLVKRKAIKRGDAKADKTPYLSFRARPPQETDDSEELLGPTLHWWQKLSARK